MAEQDQNAASSSSTINDREVSAAASSSSNSSLVRQEEEDRDQHRHGFPHSESEHRQTDISYRESALAVDDSPTVIGDDTWSCSIVILTFWFFVSMTLILGVYGSTTLKLAPNTSILFQPSPIFVQHIKVEKLNGSNPGPGPGPTLYGFYKPPPLDIAITWAETRDVSVEADSHQEWSYFLNDGSEINISYRINSLNSSIFLIIAEGSESLSQWLENPSYPNTTLSWNVIHGDGMIHADINKPSSYYVAVGNLNSEEVEVQLNFRLSALIYNTTDAYYKCTLASGSCGLNVLFPEGDAALLTSPGPDQATSSEGWYVRVSYEPRWATYVVGAGGMTLLMVVAFNFLNKFRCTREDATGIQYGETGPERAPLLPHKDDDVSSWESSCDSASHDEEDLDGLLAAGSLAGKPIKDDENTNNTRRLCAICFDAPRDCFFLPCGHCVACFECGTRIAEAACTCPICRRNIKKVRMIYTV